MAAQLHNAVRLILVGVVVLSPIACASRPATEAPTAPLRTHQPHPASMQSVAIVQAQIAMFDVALETFEVDTGRYPTTREGLQALMQAPEGLKGWHGPYIYPNVPKDPWGNPFVYVCPGKHNPAGYDLHSFGPSGKDGAEDNIDNWTPR